MRSLALNALTRLLPVGLITLSVHRVVFARHEVFDVKLQLVLALVVAAGTTAGADKGAIAGFVLGLLYDIAGNTPLGMTALAYGMAGMTAGYVQSLTPDPQWWLASIFATLGAAVGEAGVPALELMTGRVDGLDPRLAWTVPMVAVSCGLACTPLMPIGRWAVGVRRKKWKVITE